MGRLFTNKIGAVGHLARLRETETMRAENGCLHGSPLLRLSHSALVYLLYRRSKLAPTSISSGSKL